MSSGRGRELALELLRHSDVAAENYSPRVVEEWGFTWDRLQSLNPALIFVRAPAYGLSGPWRERVGYAQTIEMTAGLAWVTGPKDAAPDIPNGLCDPNAGLHATIALLLALEHRRKTGEGMLLEVPMVGGALNIAGEQVVEYSAYGRLLERDGNRSPSAAPQGIYKSATDDLPFDQGRWVTIAVETEAQWHGLCRALGEPDWASAADLQTMAGRRAAHDAIDEALSTWCAPRDADAIVDALWAAGVPAAKVVLPHEQASNPQLLARQYFTTVTHPVTGENLHGGFPGDVLGGSGAGRPPPRATAHARPAQPRCAVLGARPRRRRDRQAGGRWRHRHRGRRRIGLVSPSKGNLR